MRIADNTIQQDMHEVAAEVGDLVAATGQEGRAAAMDVRERLKRTLELARQSAAQIDGRVRHSARHAAERTDDYVHDSPWRAIGISALFGLLAGVVIARS